MFCGEWCIGRIYETRTGSADLRWFWALHAPSKPGCGQSRPRESEQGDKWSFCLTAGTLCPAKIRRNNEQTTTSEPHTGFQGQGGLAAVKGDETLAQLAEQFNVHPNEITRGRRSSRKGQPVYSDRTAATRLRPAVDVPSLHAKIGELTLENDFWQARSAKQVC